MTLGAIIPIDGLRDYPAEAHCQVCGTSRALRMVAGGVFVCSNRARCAENVNKKKRRRRK